jgi:hypothetical protein
MGARNTCHLAPINGATVLVLCAISAWSATCPSFTHMDDITIVNRSTLPVGYYIFGRASSTGLYRSLVHSCRIQQVPGTGSDIVEYTDISDDGHWILYVDSRVPKIVLTLIDGSHRIAVPVDSVEPGFPTIAGFYRRSPLGDEIFYMADSYTLRAVRTTLQDTNVSFGADRTIARLLDPTRLETRVVMNIHDSYGISADQVFGNFCPWNGSSFVWRSGYLTIPLGGTGTATTADLYQWKNDSLQTTNGCQHTMSHDGRYCLANPGSVGSACVPRWNHKGFYITPFRRKGDPPVDIYAENIDVYGTSINWCPAEYRFGTGSEVNFTDWHFSNDTEYVIGAQEGSRSPYHGMWLVAWRTSTWSQLSPDTDSIDVSHPSAYLGAVDSLSFDTATAPVDSGTDTIPHMDPFDPHYRVLSPNGNEVFRAGEACTVRVTSTKHGNAVARVSPDGGLSLFDLPGLTRSIDPLSDSVIVWTIPHWFVSAHPGGGLDSTSLVSDYCQIVIQDYSVDTYRDESDSFFRIIDSGGAWALGRSRSASVPPPRSMTTTRLGFAHAGGVVGHLHDGARFAIYDMRGRFMSGMTGAGTGPHGVPDRVRVLAGGSYVLRVTYP